MTILNNNKNGSELYLVAQVNVAIAQSRLGKYNLANNNFKSYLKTNNLSFRDKVPAISGLGKNLTHQGKYADAQKYYQEVIKIDSLKGSKQYYQGYCDIIDNVIKMMDKEKVNIYLKPLHKSNASLKSIRLKLGYYISASNAYKLLEKHKIASLYQDSIIYCKDSISNSRYSKILSELETKYQTRKKEEQIVEEQSKKELWSYISIFAFIVLLMVAILLYKNSQKRKQLNANKIELEKLLNQRNMLLKETHHRVKNSFQMVSSLLQLQAQESEAEVAVTALDNAVQRVNSMIVLHQQLYAKDNLLGVDLKTYINDLIEEIMSSYTSENINFKSTIVSKVLDIDTATSIGLLVNELATNSIKYAWDSESKEKNITLDISLKNEEFQFTMFDNGKAVKTSTTKQNYGSELIEILIERLEAKQIRLSQSDFGLHITFKKNSYTI